MGSTQPFEATPDARPRPQEESPKPPSGPEEAAGRLLDILNDSSAALLVVLGHRTGLFEVMAALPAAPSRLVADAAGLEERYVREWLGGMVSAGFIDYRPAEATYHLRPEYIPLVTGTGTDNLARTLQYVPLLGAVGPQIVQAFRHGGGTLYSDYPQFHQVMAAESAAVNDAALLDRIMPLTGREAALRTGISVADIGCGEGHAMNLLAAAFPLSSFTGFDFSHAALEAAAAEATTLGLTNVRFEYCDVARLGRDQEFDLITAFDAIHDQAQPGTVLQQVRAALKPGGTFLMVDINASSNLEENTSLPWATFLYAVSTFHCMAVSLGQGGVGLGTVWGRELAATMLAEAGFANVAAMYLDEDPFNVYFIAE
ncbi:class I SAM-dependent methyltransferase [Paenarthrobacter sp. NCHU4564]|uniref:class I SAM-dependent methyltransferase n=1 Tax=Paenarthrobacter sp. NCHU4564 TaxID=3451353 RepID=UPI003F97A10A